MNFLLVIYETIEKIEEDIPHDCRVSFRIIDGGLCLELKYKRSIDGEVCWISEAWTREFIAMRGSDALIEGFIRNANTAIRKSYEAVERKGDLA